MFHQPPDLYRAIVEQSADAIIFADPNGLIGIWNAASERLFGFSTEEVLGQSLDIIIPERLREPHWRGYTAAMKSGKTKHAGRPTLTKALHKSGVSIYVQMSFSAIVSEEGTVFGSMAMARPAPPPVRQPA